MAGMVVVGGGQAGYSIVSTLRRSGFSGEISLVCEEDALPYQRPPLSKRFLLGEVEEDRLLFRKEQFYSDNKISVFRGVKAVSIDRKKYAVFLSNNMELRYEKLFLATGAKPLLFPQIRGQKNDNLFYIRSLNDVKVIQERFKSRKRLLIIGGGYIGLEVAAAARKKDLIVTVVEAQPRVLHRVSSEQTSKFFGLLHKKNGVRIIEGINVSSLEMKSQEILVKLGSGEFLESDLVIVGIGVSPDTKLAETADLDLENGIIVDEYCRTSDKNIFAAGDCTNFPYKGKRLRLESVGNAIDQGETAAFNALGNKKEYQAKPWFWSDQYSTKLQIAGLSAGYDDVVERKSDKGVSFWYYRNKRLIAVDAMDEARAYMIGKKLIEHGISPNRSIISDTKTDLVSLL
ncbi:MAG: FAD-dependent oxidoreductase [Pseudomonadota bacterium]|nr:FAD-dependent oxidoreductase [Pseudomonadota bacterium]